MLAAGCPRGTAGGAERVVAPTLEVTLTTDRDAYAPGDTAVATLAVVNRGTEAVTLDFGTGQRYDFELLDLDGARRWRWSDGRGFIQMIGQETIEAGARRAYRERIPLPGVPGGYRLAGAITAAQALRVETPVVVRGREE